MCKISETTSCKEILELRRRRWHAAHYFVATDAGKDDAISLRRHARRELAARFVKTNAGAGGRGKAIAVEFELERFLLADVDVGTGSATLFFHFGEIGTLVPVGFGVVVIGEGVEAWGFSGAASDNGVGHAHDGGGVHAA